MAGPPDTRPPGWVRCRDAPATPDPSWDRRPGGFPV